MSMSMSEAESESESERRLILILILDACIVAKRVSCGVELAGMSSMKVRLMCFGALFASLVRFF